MAAKRKTFEVAALKDNANRLLALKGPEFTPQFREGVIAMIEPILMRSGNYKGFKYRLSEFDFSTGEGKLKKNYDNTRREYY